MQATARMASVVSSTLPASHLPTPDPGRWIEKILMRSGLRIDGQRGDPEVKGAMVRFAKGLRKNYDFPIRVPVYLRPEEELTNMHGEQCSASFFGPWSMDDEPYIRIATGAYRSERLTSKRDDVLARYLGSLAHEVIHYQQWVKNNKLYERGVPAKAGRMVDAYAQTTDHP